MPHYDPFEKCVSCFAACYSKNVHCNGKFCVVFKMKVIEVGVCGDLQAKTSALLEFEVLQSADAIEIFF